MEELSSTLNNALELIIDKVSGWISTFIEMLPNLAMAIVTFILFLLLSRLARNVVKKLFDRTSDNKSVRSLLTTIAYYSVLGIGIFFILGILNLDKTVTSLLAGVGIIGLALGFAFQDIAANFISGIMLSIRKPFAIGDRVKVGGYFGDVSETNLRTTVIKTGSGQMIYIPNSEVLSNAIENFDQTGERRIDLEVGVSYADDLDKAEKLAVSAIESLDGVIHKDNIILSYYEFGGSSINFEIRFFTEYKSEGHYIKVRSAAIKAINNAFAEGDISIPFPIRTLDFGIEGGASLSEMRFNVDTKSSN
jgi:small conductance mechanosensitive channel